MNKKLKEKIKSQASLSQDEIRSLISESKEIKREGTDNHNIQKLTYRCIVDGQAVYLYTLLRDEYVEGVLGFSYKLD